jgi:hypothetical protein
MRVDARHSQLERVEIGRHRLRELAQYANRGRITYR